jgi:PAS domain S-box-containing protein
MQTANTVSSKTRSQWWLRAGSILISFAAVTLLATAFGAHLYSGSLSSILLTLVLIALCVAIALHVRFLLLARREHRETASTLDATEREYKSVFDNALDGVLILDDQGICLEANPAAVRLFATEHDELVGEPIGKFYAGPGDSKEAWKRFLEHRYEHSETQIRRGDGETIFVEYTAKANYLPGRHVAVLRDISRRKQAEEQMARNLDMAVSAEAEADAFRKTTLALTQNLSMDYVLDTLLESLLKLIPCESARVLLVEADTRIFVAREMQDRETSRRVPKPPATLDATDNRFLMQVLITRNSLLIADTSKEAEWAAFKGFSNLRSWLCVPLVASRQVLGLLSLGDTRAQAFTQEHLRLAKSLAIPAAVAIQNARLYERAEIYGAELEHRLADLEMTQQALRLAEEGRTLSEERFTKVFRSSPIAFSITTMDEDRLVDVNDAFERRYGYSREQLIGRTVFETGVWDDASERRQVLNEIRQQGGVRNHVTRFRRPSGELVDTIFSAQAVELDGRACLLAVSEDLPDRAHFPGGPTHKTAAAH